MVKIISILLFLCANCLNLVLAETVGIKENLKDLDDNDVLVISVAHAKKDTKNSTVEKLVSLSTEGFTKSSFEDAVDTDNVTQSSTLRTTSAITAHLVAEKEIKAV